MTHSNFDKLVSSFKSSIKTWNYFVNWKKVFANKADLEITLNKLNYLLGKEDLKGELGRLLNDSPDVIRAFPVLLAVRESSLEIYDKELRTSEIYDFSSGRLDAEKVYEFMQKSGLATLFQKDGIKNLVDYVMGVEVGLDSNGRKNRGGSLMEEIVGSFIKAFCAMHGYEYIAQATATQIHAKWGVAVKVNKSERSFDFAVFNPNTRVLKLFETNFYNGGGSKLKAVCGEFQILNDELKAQGIEFIWITDGLGWKTALRPLEETFNHNDYVFNLSMLEQGVLGTLHW